jgi:2-desacetyl-2-hydroxyethyl bacteriochlorophyllide A dehydrogenase
LKPYKEHIMQAIVFTAPEQISIQQVDDPACGVDEVIVKVSQVGICGTDIHIIHNDYHSTFPLIAGHEFVGQVVDTDVNVSSLQRGERVAVDPNLYCGECYFCRQEQSNHCLNWQGVGITRPGGFAEYVAVPARACYKVPETLTDVQAAFIEPLSCVIHALKRMRTWPGDEVLIFGAGPMGLILVQAMRHTGASRIVVVEKQPDRRNLALRMGADTAMAPDPDLAKQLFELAPYGYAIVIDATGVLEVIQSALQYVKPRGQYLQFGVTSRDVTVQWEPYDIYHKDLTIVGSFALCYTFQPAIAWLENRVVKVEPLVSHILPLAKFRQGFRDFSEGRTLKVHLRP